MKKRIVVVLLGILLLLGITGYLALSARLIFSLQPTPTPTSSVADTYCKPVALQAQVSLSPGAGNVYGTFTLKNISQTSCKILGGHFISVHFDNAVKNIAITHIGHTQTEPFFLQAGQTLYSQIHYPNGPQCQSIGVTSVPLTFTYQISPTSTVNFVSIDQYTKPVVQACKSPTDVTTIEIWSMATQPITH